MTRRRTLLGAGALLLLPAAVLALDAAARREATRGGVALLLRHARTEPGIGDPPGYRLDDCATQRNLSADGRAQARAIGAALTQAGVRIDAVRASPWCRCVDTARLAFPTLRVDADRALASFFDDRAAEPGITAAARALLARLAASADRANWALVTHMVNVAALTGTAVPMGGGVLVRPRADGTLTLLGEFAPPG